jgi:hypothetical protein
MGGFFSFDKNQDLSPLEDPAASGSEKDFEVAFNGSPAAGTATASHHPGAAGFTHAAVPTGQKGMGTLTRVANVATNSSTESVASAKLP